MSNYYDMDFWLEPHMRNAKVCSAMEINGVLLMKFHYSNPRERDIGLIYPCDILPQTFHVDMGSGSLKDECLNIFEVEDFNDATGKYIRVESDSKRAYSIHHIFNDYGVVGDIPA